MLLHFPSRPFSCQSERALSLALSASVTRCTLFSTLFSTLSTLSRPQQADRTNPLSTPRLPRLLSTPDTTTTTTALPASPPAPRLSLAPSSSPANKTTKQLLFPRVRKVSREVFALRPHPAPGRGKFSLHHAHQLFPARILP
ncbi:hypothetical protein AOQ84DRAFT_19146 [Glonium stellatum]|uniref:Uncharacterized protein n=1 Tax=Glonium stellatum TaxID=574774 RepID=A0A8E2FE91_9PEZI|nr:hypothetical protein AOQ84DRAFT_19146 [Glonium stellatum]